MKKQGLFTWFAAALLGAALVLAGCESPADGSHGAPGPVYLSGGVSTAGINAALGSGAPVVFAGVVQSDAGGVVIPAGVTVKLVGSPAYTAYAADTGALLTFAPGSSITGSGTINAANVPVIGLSVLSEALRSQILNANEVSLATVDDEGAVDFGGGTAAALHGDYTTDGESEGYINLSAVESDKTLYIAGNFAVTEGVELDGALTVTDTLTVGTPGVAANTAQASRRLGAGEAPSVEMTVKGALNIGGTLVVGAGAKITVKNSGKLNRLAGAAITNSAGEIAFEADTVEGLNDVAGEGDAVTPGKIAAVKAAGGDSAGAYVQLTEAFYTAANDEGNTSAIVVDPGEADNTTAYTIRGLGTAEDDTALSVGILLANDYVTLEDVKVAVNCVNKAAITGSNSYKAAVSITRSEAGTTQLTGTDQANHYVTVQDCDITYSAPSGMAAGILVSGDSGTPSSIPSSNISIINNKVTATNQSGSATQAILFRRTGSSFTLTGNVLTSSNKGDGKSDAPASALLLQTKQDAFTGMPEIEDNKLRGKEFDFYVTLSSTGDRTGNTGLFGDKFGTADSKWATGAATDTGSPYKLLLNALLDQAKGPTDEDGENGAKTFGRFLQWLGEDAGSYTGDFALEYYEIDSGVITAVNFWSAGIEENAETYTDGDDKKPKTEAASDKNGIRARFTVSGSTTTQEGNFHWTRTDEDGQNLPEQEE
ncbi:MAG: hypothetical protein LBO04_00350 [Spirochaetaceae bacterium]|jgi:hypothetical protein|nr:hypothetical protein [Spirochaetaceae bacterium]